MFAVYSLSFAADKALIMISYHTSSVCFRSDKYFAAVVCEHSWLLRSNFITAVVAIIDCCGDKVNFETEITAATVVFD